MLKEKKHEEDEYYLHTLMNEKQKTVVFVIFACKKTKQDLAIMNLKKLKNSY